MSMMKTLAKVAIGVVVAKGVSSMMNKGAAKPRAAAPRREAGTGGLFGGVHSPGGDPRGGTADPAGLEDILGSVLGGRETHAGQAGQSGGLGGLLEEMTRGRAASGGGGSGMNDLLRGTTQPKDTPSFGEDETAAEAPPRSFGDMLNQAILTQEEPDEPPAPDQEALAALMLRAMIQAMKSDGEIDPEEERRLLDRLGDISSDEMAFVTEEMRKPVDAKALAAEIPRGLEPQVYTMSVMGIDLDTQTEAQYLHDFAQALGLEPQTVNDIHAKLGVPQLYR